MTAQRRFTLPKPATRQVVLGHARSDGIDPVWLATALVVAMILIWTSVILVIDRAQFAILSPRAQVGVEAASAFARLFAALVLLLFPDERARNRLRWIAAGLLTVGFGSLFFGYLQPLLIGQISLNTAMYESLGVWVVAGLFFVIGLVPDSPPAMTKRRILSIAVAVAAVGLIVMVVGESLPTLVRIDTIESATAVHGTPLRGLTPWHWALSSLPIALALVAGVGALRQYSRGLLGGWLVIAMALFTGAKLHNMFWPSAYSPVLTTANLLRFAFAAVVAVAGVLELRRIAAERAAVAEAEREYAQRLADLATLRADFTAMVAHELGSPIAAIRGYTDVLATGELDREAEKQAIETIRTESDLLAALVADVRSIAMVERDDFTVQLRPVPLDDVLVDAAAFAATLPGDHLLSVSEARGVRVLADPERIGQVLRNLLSNAAKYSPEGTPIAIRVALDESRARVEVRDRGYGIHPDDLRRVFEKFARGRDIRGNHVPGVGVGLYLSRRIVQLHGSDITVDSTLGVGSTFGFELEIVR